MYAHLHWNSKLNAKLRLELQVEYGFKLEFQVEWLIRRESVCLGNGLLMHLIAPYTINCILKNS